MVAENKVRDLMAELQASLDQAKAEAAKRRPGPCECQDALRGCTLRWADPETRLCQACIDRGCRGPERRAEGSHDEGSQ